MTDTGVSQGESMTFTFFYVGKGDCTLVEFPSGRLFGVIDSHKPRWHRRCPAAEALEESVRKAKESNSLGDAALEVAFICVSHPHYDHVHCLSDVLSVKQVRIREVWHTLPDLAKILLMNRPGTTEYINVLAEVSRVYQEDQIEEFVEFVRKARETVGEDNIRQVMGFNIVPDIEGVQVYILNPTDLALGPFRKAIKKYLRGLRLPTKELFDALSLAVLFVYGDNALLYASDMQGDRWVEVMGDITQRETLKHHLPAIRVIKASHHGGCRSFYKDLWTEVLGTSNGDGRVIVSGGDPSHPHETFIDSVLAARKTLYCTGYGDKCALNVGTSDHFKFQVERLMKHYGARVGSSKFRPCCGDIRVVLPRQGLPQIIPDAPRMAGSCCA